jgi:cell division protein FtsX
MRIRSRTLYRPQTAESVIVGLIIALVATAIVGLTLAIFWHLWLGVAMAAGVFGLSIDVLFFPPPEGKA